MIRKILIVGLSLVLAGLSLAQGVKREARFAQKAPGQGLKRLLKDKDRPTVPPFVLKAIVAARTLRYSGTRVVEFRSGSERKRHIEYVLKDGPKTRIEFPSDSPSSGQVIIEVGPNRFHYVPGKDEVQKMPARGDDSLARLAAMTKNPKRFKIVSAGGDKIAGIRSLRANFADASGNNVQSLWIDPKSGLILKRELYDQVGSVVGSFEFQTVNLNPTIRPEDFTMNRKGAKVIRLNEKLHRLCDENGFVASSIKENQGYELIAVRVMNPKGAQPILMQTYQSKSGVVSLFQIAGEVNPKRLQRLAQSKYQTYTWTASNRSYALIGNMSETDLERISGLVGQR